jgi:hypothetical protein
LHEAGLLRAALHGSPQSLQLVFINFKSNSSKEAVEVFTNSDFLPEQASFRLVPRTFGIDAIISGQLPPQWFEQAVVADGEYYKYILDFCQLSFRDVMRYRWHSCSEQNPLMDPQMNPSIDEAQRFLDKDNDATRLIYDLTQLPILPAYALINLDTRFQTLWEVLGKEYREPVRDIYHDHEYKDPLGGDIAISKQDLRELEYLAVCEFDNFTNVNGNNQYDINSAMNRMYEWRSKVLSLRGIRSVSIIPCVIIKDSYEILDDVGRLKVFKPAINLATISQFDESRERDIPFPVWTSLICGGPRAGKSVTAFYIMAALLMGSPAHDVIFVNYKRSVDRTDAGEGPALTEEVVNFVRMIHERTRKTTRLVRPEDLEQTLISSGGVCAYYTEGHQSIDAGDILKAVASACHHNKDNGAARNCFVVFDEVLNQKGKAAAHMKDILKAHNEYQSLNLFTGVIGQQLERFWEIDEARAYALESTTVVAGPLLGKDVEHFESLQKRAKGSAGLGMPVSSDELEKCGRGQFIFLPYTSTKQEQPVRVKMVEVATPSREKPEKMPALWKWGEEVSD